MILLGGVQLNDEIVWEDRDFSSQVAQSVNRTLGGKPIIISAPLLKGNPITLVAVQDAGWLKKSTVNALIDLANVPGAVYELSVQVRAMTEETFNVMFRSDDPPAVEFSPLIFRQDQQDDEWLIGRIKLIEVN